MLVISNRNENGTMIAVASSFTFIIVFLGLAFIQLMSFLGGTREVQSAVDSGNLNVARMALDSPYVLIDEKSSAVRRQFLPISNNGRISLRNINKVMALELLTQTNLKSMRISGTATAATEDHVKRLCDEAETIAAELAAKLEDKKNFVASFDELSKKNSLRMLIGSNEHELSLINHQVSYMNRGEASNVSFDYEQIPANVRGVFRDNEEKWFKKIGGKMYFRGYTSGIKVLDREVHFVPLYEGSYDPIAAVVKAFPHLVSNKDFQSQKVPDSGSAAFNWKGAVPNAFLSEARIDLDNSEKRASIAHSCAVSNENKVYDVLAQGYIKIVNPRGYAPVGSIPAADNIFNAELMSGINLISDGTNTLGFSTDQAAIEALIAYNKDPLHQPAPAVLDSDGNPVFFDRQGNPIEDLALLKSAVKRASTCTCTNTLPAPGSQPDTDCGEVMGAFFNAYPHKDSNLPTGDGGTQLMAVEEARYQLMLSYQEAYKKWIVLCAAGYKPWEANVKGIFPSINTRFPYFSGIRKFDIDSINATLNTSSLIFSKAGTIDEYLKQVSLATVKAKFWTTAAGYVGETLSFASFDRSTKPDPATEARVNRALEELLERVKEFAPATTMSELRKLFADKDITLQLDSNAYLYLDPDKHKLVLSKTPPPWAMDSESAKAAADGKSDMIKSLTYHLLDCVVNAPHDNLHDVYFYVNPSWSTTALANDILIWTPSSGCNGLLGTVEFRNLCYNANDADAEFYQPN